MKIRGHKVLFFLALLKIMMLGKGDRNERFSTNIGRV